MSQVHSIWSREDRQRLSQVILDPMRVPNGTRVEFKAIRRSNGQNTRFWGTITSISEQVIWYGEKLSPEEWRTIFSAALRKAKIVPGIDGASFVPLGLSTRDLDRDQFDQLQEIIYAFGAERGVIFNDPRETPPEEVF